MSTKIVKGDKVKLLPSDIIDEVIGKYRQGSYLWYLINIGGTVRYYFRFELEKIIY